jgi:hypothetical protein
MLWTLSAISEKSGITGRTILILDWNTGTPPKIAGTSLILNDLHGFSKLHVTEPAVSHADTFNN